MGWIGWYSENVEVQYRSHWCSKATLFNIVMMILILISPYLIAYRTQGLWKRLELVHEQPKVLFKHEALLILDTVAESNTGGSDLQRSKMTDTMIWTTFPGLSAMLQSKLKPFIMSREGDENLDGHADFLDIEIYIPLQNKERVTGVHLMFLFDYKLTENARFQMEGMVYMSSEGSWGGVDKNRLEVIGDLGLVQKQPLWNRVKDQRYNFPVIPRNSSSLDDYSFAKIIREYSQRNVSTQLKNVYSMWTTDSEVDKEFVIKVKVHYSPVTYECWSGLWTMLKWAWVQYVAILALIIPIGRLFQRTVFKSRLFDAQLYVPWGQHVK